MQKASVPPSKRVYLKAVAKRKPTITEVPDEILLKIFSLLEPTDLVTAACVCCRWLQLSRDNTLWRSVYVKYVNKKTEVPEEAPASYWRDLCIKRGTHWRNQKLFHLLRKVNTFTKLPQHVNDCLKKGDIRWQLTLTDNDGTAHTFLHNDVFTFLTSVTVRWFSLSFPALRGIRKLRLHSLNPVFYMGDGQAFKNSPCQRSLILETDVRWHQLQSADGAVESGPLTCHVIGDNDQILLATWKDGGEMAFVSVMLHHRHLVESCLRGSSDKRYEPPEHKPYVDDIDPKFGLHGYSCVVELRNQRTVLWTEGFSDLFSSQPPGSGVELCLVSSADRVYHHIISRPLSLPWKTDLFKGVVGGLCVLDMTLADERGTIIWCFSCPVRVVAADGAAGPDFEFDGNQFSISYTCDRGQVYMRLNKDPSTSELSVTNFYIKLATQTINDWFGTSY